LNKPSRYFIVPDMDENTFLNLSLREFQPFFGWTTWQSHLENFFKNN